MKQETITLTAEEALDKAKECEEKDQLIQAQHYYKAILTFNPNHTEALLGIAIICTKLEDEENAYAYAYRALKCGSNQAKFYTELGRIFYTIKKKQTAIAAFLKAEKLEPQNCFIQESLVTIYAQEPAANHEKSLHHAKKKLKLGIDYPTYIALANNYTKLNKPTEALIYCDKAITLDPKPKMAYLAKARILFNKGQHDEAYEILTKENLTKDSAIYYSIAYSKKFAKEEGEALIAEINTYLQSNDLQPVEESGCYFALAKLSDDIKAYDDAFTYYKRANSLKQEANLQSDKPKFDMVNYEYTAEKVRSIFNASFLQQRKQIAIPTKLPIFIVGMPRSGTTLTEQILSSHSKVKGAGEAEYMHTTPHHLPQSKHPITTETLSYPENIQFLQKKELQEAAKKYIQSCIQFIAERDETTKGYTKITDKLPSNSERVGLILLLFSNAKIINCYRHPLDVCLSIFFQNFAVIEYSFDLENIARVYKQYFKNMEHWQKEFPNKILSVYYEELVLHQDSITKKMLDYCELSWEEECLNFHDNQRSIHTASNWQVKQPLYTRSKFRFKNYEPHIGLFREMLKDEITIYEARLQERLDAYTH